MIQCDGLCAIHGKETPLMSVLKVCEHLVKQGRDLPRLSSVGLDG
jgi:hypothetical protein